MEVRIVTTRKYKTSDGQEFDDIRDANNHVCQQQLLAILQRGDVVANAGGWTNEMVIAFIMANIEEIKVALAPPKLKEEY